MFCPNSVIVARYDALIRTKSPTNCDAHLAENLFQTCSNPEKTISAPDIIFISVYGRNKERSINH
ncbi:DUF6783 domain-containing protein [Blautia sp.]|uniref:DUF6783 domain-containing protein n=1 Tax=Blautia sp. TaxID=1955243 RepID=UPI002FE6D2E4